PNLRTMIDSNTNIDFFRPAPDSRRILFGGGTGIDRGDFPAIATFLHGLLVRVLPQLSAVRLSPVWTGFCAGTFAPLPHIGGRARSDLVRPRLQLRRRADGHPFRGEAGGSRSGARGRALGLRRDALSHSALLFRQALVRVARHALLRLEGRQARLGRPALTL